MYKQQQQQQEEQQEEQQDAENPFLDPPFLRIKTTPIFSPSSLVKVLKVYDITFFSTIELSISKSIFFP
jgi:hypothetical protein